jgi:hypothetical protein
MNFIRWLFLFPISSAAAFFTLWGLTKATGPIAYSPSRPFEAIVIITPSFVLATLPHAVFVLCGFLIAPKKSAPVAILLAVITLLAPLPFLASLHIGDPLFDVLRYAASALGATLGAIAAIFWCRKKKKAAPNKPVTQRRGADAPQRG